MSILPGVKTKADIEAETLPPPTDTWLMAMLISHAGVWLQRDTLLPYSPCENKKNSNHYSCYKIEYMHVPTSLCDYLVPYSDF